MYFSLKGAILVLFNYTVKSTATLVEEINKCKYVQKPGNRRRKELDWTTVLYHSLGLEMSPKATYRRLVLQPMVLLGEGLLGVKSGN